MKNPWQTDLSTRPKPARRRWVLFFLGWASLALGCLGIVLPLLPTVPLLLLAAACFARSSERFYNWLLDHQRLGPIIRPFLEGAGLPIRSKIRAIVLVWMSILLSALFFTDTSWIRLLLLVIAAGVTVYLAKLPTPTQGD